MTQQNNGVDILNQYREDKAGSDCSGSDGATGRVLTLANTLLTANEEVFVDGLLVDPSTYSASHLSSSSTITFTTPKIYNSQYIIVRYKYA